MQRNAPSKIDPEILGELHYEQNFTQSISNTKRQVKLEKGKMWRIRYLPAKLGPKKTFFARIAKHWLATKPVVCPRQTSPAFGGDPDSYCPVCDRSHELNESTNQAESQLGYESRSNPQWLVYCVVFEKDGSEQSMQEVLVPYEHWMYKSTWEELKAFYMAGGQKSPLSVLDYKLGNDFIVSRTSKGFKLDKQDSMPIFDSNDSKYVDWIKKIEEQLKNPRVQMPKDEELQAFVIKLEEQVNQLRGIRGSARRGQPSVGLEEEETQPQHEENVDDPESPSRAPAAAARPAARRPAPAPAPEPEPEPEPAPEDEDQIPGAEMPAKPAPARAAAPVAAARPVTPAPAPARAAARPVDSAPATRRPAPQPEPEPEPEPQDPDFEPEPAPAPRVQAGRAAARPAAPVATRRPVSQPEPEAEDDPLPPDETSDQAPPAPLDGVEDEGEPAAAPPTISRKGAALGSAIRDKINAVKNRGL